VVEPCCRQSGMLLQCLLDEGQVRLDHARSLEALHAGQPRLRQHPVDGVMMDPELGGNGMHPPAFHMVITQDVGFTVFVDGHSGLLWQTVPEGGSCQCASNLAGGPVRGMKNVTVCAQQVEGSPTAGIHCRVPRRIDSQPSALCSDEPAGRNDHVPERLHHAASRGQNPDASLYRPQEAPVQAPVRGWLPDGSGKPAGVGHGRTVRADLVDSAGPRPGPMRAGLRWHSAKSNGSDHGHSDDRS